MFHECKRMKWVYCVLLVVMLSVTGCAGTAKSIESAPPAYGAGSFTLLEPTGESESALTVYYYKPQQWTPDRPVIVVQHGVRRNAAEYRDSWIEDADKYNFLVVCPEFSKTKYPGGQYYNLANMFDKNNTQDYLTPENKWTFAAIDHVVEAVKKQFSATGEFILFGHSAGAQFVHRYMLFYDHGVFSHIIIANAGWYTMLDSNTYFPYGTKNISMLNAERTAHIFSEPVTIMLGEADTAETDRVLRKTKEAEAQGPNRFTRGMNFFHTAQAQATAVGVPFNWKLVTVPGVGHSDAGMAKAAVENLFSK